MKKRPISARNVKRKYYIHLDPVLSITMKNLILLLIAWRPMKTINYIIYYINWKLSPKTAHQQTLFAHTHLKFINNSLFKSHGPFAIIQQFTFSNNNRFHNQTDLELILHKQLLSSVRVLSESQQKVRLNITILKFI